MKFKEGQEIVVLGAYVGGSNAQGRFIRECRQPENKGKYLVQIESNMEMVVELDRIVDSKEYFKR